jgi:glutathione S-transferase
VINQWVESEAHNFYPPQRALFKEIYVARAMNRPMDEELISTCTAQLCKVLDVYEAHLSSKGGMQYLAGDEFTLADVMHTPYFWQVMQHKAEVLQPRPHVAAYAARITARPAFHKCLQLNWDAALPLH